MVLPDHVGELLRAQLVGERPRRVCVEARRGEQARPAPRLGARGSSAEHGGNLLAAALDGDAPDARAGLGDLFEVARLGDLLAVDREHDVAALEAELLRERAIGDVERRPRPRSTESSRSSSASAGDRFATFAPWNGERAWITISSRGASGAVSSATAILLSLPPRTTPSSTLPPSGWVAKR